MRLAFALCALIAACSPPSLANQDAGAKSIAQACADSAFARCNRFQACSPVVVQIRYGDEPTCEALLQASCMGNLAAPSTGASPATSEACTQEIPTWACNDYLDDLNPPPDCLAQHGALGSGAACAFPAQCASSFCAIAPGAACGVCSAAAAAPGDSCAALTTCGPGLTCNADTSACVSYAPVGTMCAPGQPCVPGSACEGASTTTGTLGTCDLSASTLGAACSTTAGGCDNLQGLACSSDTKQCVALQLAGGAQPCGTVGGVQTTCTSGGRCVGASAATPGACTTTVGLGGACDLSVGPDCVSPSRCIVGADGGTAGTCQIPDATTCP